MVNRDTIPNELKMAALIIIIIVALVVVAPLVYSIYKKSQKINGGGRFVQFQKTIKPPRINRKW